MFECNETKSFILLYFSISLPSKVYLVVTFIENNLAGHMDMIYFILREGNFIHHILNRILNP